MISSNTPVQTIKWSVLGLSFVVALLIWFLPVPEGMDPKSWQLFAIFAGLIIGLIGKALPMGALSFLALTILMVTHTLTVKEAFSGFSHPIIWLVVAAFLLSRSFIKTGLGMRFAYFFVYLLGKKTLGLGYGIQMTELLLAPAIPSNTARAGGIVYPIVRALAVSFGSTPEKHSQRLIGGFLVMNAYYANLVTSAMFLTAMAANPFIVLILAEHGIPVSWGNWVLAALVPGIISMLIIPYFLYKVYPPDIKETPEAKEIAIKHLAEMGAMSRNEKITLGVFIVLVFLWIFGEAYLAIDSTTVAFIGVSALILTKVLTWDDIKKEYEAWDTLIWFSTLIMLASQLNQMGLIKWISGHIQFLMSDISWQGVWPLLVLIYFYSHYLFASNTAHVTSLFAAILDIGIVLNVPPYLMAFSLAFSSSLFACVTHYGTGAAPILFGSEYVNVKTWWRLGALMSVLFLLIWVWIGSLWWKWLGFW